MRTASPAFLAPLVLGSKRNALWDKVQNVFLVLCVGAPDCQGDNFRSGILYCRLYEAQRILSGAKDKP